MTEPVVPDGSYGRSPCVAVDVLWTVCRRSGAVRCSRAATSPRGGGRRGSDRAAVPTRGDRRADRSPAPLRRRPHLIGALSLFRGHTRGGAPGVKCVVIDVTPPMGPCVAPGLDGTHPSGPCWAVWHPRDRPGSAPALSRGGGAFVMPGVWRTGSSRRRGHVRCARKPPCRQGRLGCLSSPRPAQEDGVMSGTQRRARRPRRNGVAGVGRRAAIRRTEIGRAHV